MPTEAEEFEFRARAEKEAAAKTMTPSVSAPSGVGTPQSLAKVQKDVSSFKNSAEADKYLEKLKASGVDLSVPSPEVLAVENKRRELNEAQMTLWDKTKSVAGGAASGALANMAAVPAIGGAGKLLSVAGKTAPVGEALSGIAGGMAKQGAGTLAAEGAAIGGLTTSVVDYLKEHMGVSEDTANNIVMAASLTPAGVKGLWDKIVPTSAQTSAKEIVRKMHGAGSDLLTKAQQSEGMQRVLETLGVGGSIKGDTAALDSALKKAAAQRQTEILGQSRETQKGLEAGATRAGQVASTVMPRRAEQSRVRNLGPDTTSSELADEMRMLTMPKATEASQSRQEAGRRGWLNLENEAHGREDQGFYITDTPSARKAVEYINSLIEPNANGVRKIGENNPITKDLKRLRERILGDVVAEPPPKFRNFKSEIIHGFGGKKGIDPSLQRELGFGTQEAPGLFRQGGMTYDDLVEMAQQKGWMTQQDVDMFNSTSTGGAAEKVKEMVKKELAGERQYHPSQFDEAMAYNQRQGAPQRRVGMEEFDVMRRQLKAYGEKGKAGYDADMAAKAHDLEKLLVGALKEHAPASFDQRLLDYKDAAQAEEEFRTRLAKTLNERDSSDPGQMKTASHRVAEQVFAGRDPAMSFKRMIGNDQAQFDRMGLGYVSSMLRDMDSKAASKWLSGPYRDWSSELSPEARSKVSQYLSDLKKADELSASALTRQKSRIGQIAQIPGQTEKAVADSTRQLLGNKKPVDRIKELILTPMQNTEEMRAVFDAVKNQPGGREAFQNAIKSVIKEETEGAGGKKILETFDNRIADTLIAAGTHTPEEVAKLRSVVSELDGLANAKVASSSDYLDEVKRVSSSEAMKGAAIGGVLGAIGMGTAYSSGHSGITAAIGGAEALGLYMTKAAMVRNEKAINRFLQEIIADKEMFNAAIAPRDPSTIKRLQGLLAQKAQQGAFLMGEEKTAKKAVGQ